MTHPESAIAALFDHEQELEPAGAPSRRRPAPDWGGDELFSSTPRRRRPRSRTRDTGEHHLYAVPAPEDVEWAMRASGESAAEPAPVAAVALPAALELVAEPDRTEEPAAPAYTETPQPTGRRTVTITGHPEPHVPRPRRPALTVDERIGHRPDRIAGWAFALGMLLILIAILTAHMG